LGNFKDLYEEIMNNNNIEIVNDEFNNLQEETITLKPKEFYKDVIYMKQFRDFIFNRYSIDPLIQDINYPEIVLIKRGDRQPLLHDTELMSLTTNVTNGKERREIRNIEKVEDELHKLYGNKFKSFFLENKSFYEQVKIFNNAKLIILAHGAAMSNLFFCKQNTTIIEVKCGKNWEFFNVISTNLKLNHIIIEKNNPQEIISFIHKNHIGQKHKKTHLKKMCFY
jgi:hypothetical protein